MQVIPSFIKSSVIRSDSRLVNWYADPYAVYELLTPSADAAHSGLPISRTLILPLDITTPHEIPFPAYAEHIDPTFAPDQPSKAESKAPLRHFASAFLRRTREVMKSFGKDAMELHVSSSIIFEAFQRNITQTSWQDITAVWAAAQNPPTETDAVMGLADGWSIYWRTFAIERYVLSYYLQRES